MNIQRIGVNFAFLLLSSLLVCAHASDDPSQREKNLSEAYQGKTVMVRGSYCGASLEFDSAGKAREGSRPGDWTICRDIRIDHLKIENGRLLITGQRVLWYFDRVANQFREVPELWPEDAKKKEKKRFQEQMKSLAVSLRLELPADADQAGIESLLNAIFWPPDTAPAETALAIWSCYFSPKQPDCLHFQAPGGGQEGSTKALRVGGDVKGPKPVHTPDPDYSEAARGWKLQGVVLLNIAMDTEGNVRDILITRPVGLGLDMSAAAKVATWKFKPAMKAGVPVPVSMMVEVNFNLY